jgi:predicted RNA methylase
MAPGDHRETAVAAEGEPSPSDSHWVRWHKHYDDPSSPLSVRLRIVQAMVGDVLSAAADGPIRIVSMCAGQGRDVIDVLATHPRGVDATALLVELDPVLVAFARERAAAAGVTGNVRIVEGDAALSRWYADDVPADLVLVCGVFGNVSRADISRTIQALPGWCREGSEVIWTRHRRPPDATPFIRAEFAAAGFDEVGFEAPDGYVLSVGRSRLERPPGVFDPGATLFEFVGDGLLPA